MHTTSQQFPLTADVDVHTICRLQQRQPMALINTVMMVTSSPSRWKMAWLVMHRSTRRSPYRKDIRRRVSVDCIATSDHGRHPFNCRPPSFGCIHGLHGTDLTVFTLEERAWCSLALSNGKNPWLIQPKYPTRKSSSRRLQQVSMGYWLKVSWYSSFLPG